ncbi:DUF6766 family protein [Mesorhizobium sp. B2-8-5]|uniref:DUF6766 family protein n=1 Tax=Mesorhizobium sp. B2-8-5 TaxID=2589903 RepID=UPI00299F8818|nr:DUF6766 family protein [Mesorhizobium sp. B2-8-5]
MIAWQSEFLSTGVLVLLAIWLRERGSLESKPVHAPHAKRVTDSRGTTVRRGRHSV